MFSNIANAKITKINAENKAHTIFTWKTPLAQLRCEKPRPTSCRILTTSLNRAYHVTNVTHLVTTCNHVPFFPKKGYTTANLRKIRHVQVHTTRTHSLTFDWSGIKVKNTLPGVLLTKQMQGTMKSYYANGLKTQFKHSLSRFAFQNAAQEFLCGNRVFFSFTDFQKAVLFLLFSSSSLFSLCYGREKLRFLFQKINGKNPKNQLSMENDFQARNTPQRLVINSSQNIRDLLS